MPTNVEIKARVRDFDGLKARIESLSGAPCEEIPQEDGTIAYGKPSFEAEIRLPELHGESGVPWVRVSWAVERVGSPRLEGPGVDPDAPDTWTVIPDQLDPSPPRQPVPDK